MDASWRGNMIPPNHTPYAWRRLAFVIAFTAFSIAGGFLVVLL